MFKKPPAHLSNSTPLRQSDRRKVLAAILELYPEIVRGLDETDAKNVAKALVPEGLRSGAMETNSGVQGTILSSSEGDPLWLTLGRGSKDYIPTVYTLASASYQARQILPTVPLHTPIPPPVLGGAALFIPAVKHLQAPYFLPDVHSGGLVAFVEAEDGPENPTTPGRGRIVGVGRVAASPGTRGAWENWAKPDAKGRERLELAGKFCDVLNIVGDSLWSMGSAVEMPAVDIPIPSPAIRPLPAKLAGTTSAPETEMVEMQLEDVTTTPEPAKPSVVAFDPADVSTLLSLALLQGLTGLAPSAFPMPASLMYSAHVLPNRPEYIPAEKRDDVVIAKSGWKKLAKWMKEASKDGLVKTKETKDGGVTINSFDPKHPSLLNHESFVTVAMEEAKAAKKAAREAAEAGETSASGSGSKTLFEIEEFWKPSGPAISFWEACGAEHTILYKPQFLTTAFTNYVTKENLVAPNDHRQIVLDAEIGRAMGVKKPEPGQTMPRDEILAKLRANVAWSVSINGTIRKGALNPITMTVKTRQGRKTITHIHGFETFGINADDLAEELRKVCAGSASTQPLPGSSPKLQLNEVLVQGSQVKAVTEVLLARGVSKRWIREGDDFKKSKK